MGPGLDALGPGRFAGKSTQQTGKIVFGCSPRNASRPACPTALDQCPACTPVPAVRVTTTLRRATTVHDFRRTGLMALQGQVRSSVAGFGFSSHLECTHDHPRLLPPLTSDLVLLPVGKSYLGLDRLGPAGNRTGQLVRAAQTSAKYLDQAPPGNKPLPGGIANGPGPLPHIPPAAEPQQVQTLGIGPNSLIRQPKLAILQAAQQAGQSAWGLTEMADGIRRRLAYRVQALAQLLFPPIVILMGLVVMFIVVGLFLPPAISLITKLAG